MPWLSTGICFALPPFPGRGDLSSPWLPMATFSSHWGVCHLKPGLHVLLLSPCSSQALALSSTLPGFWVSEPWRPNRSWMWVTGLWAMHLKALRHVVPVKTSSVFVIFGTFLFMNVLVCLKWIADAVCLKNAVHAFLSRRCCQFEELALQGKIWKSEKEY